MRVPSKDDDNISIGQVFDESKQVEFNTLKLVKCIDYIGLSEYNPVP